MLALPLVPTGDSSFPEFAEEDVVPELLLPFVAADDVGLELLFVLFVLPADASRPLRSAAIARPTLKDSCSSCEGNAVACNTDVNDGEAPQGTTLELKSQ